MQQEKKARPELNPSLSGERWMALDVGSERIGVAISDALRLIARPLTTVRRRSLARDAEKIVELARRHHARTMVVGRPRQLDGGPSATLSLIEPLAQVLEHDWGLDVVWADERLSTREAERLMAEAGLPIEERRRKRDEYAAAVILTWYLQENSREDLSGRSG